MSSSRRTGRTRRTSWRTRGVRRDDQPGCEAPAPRRSRVATTGEASPTARRLRERPLHEPRRPTTSARARRAARGAPRSVPLGERDHALPAPGVKPLFTPRAPRSRPRSALPFTTSIRRRPGSPPPPAPRRRASGAPAGRARRGPGERGRAREETCPGRRGRTGSGTGSPRAQLGGAPVHPLDEGPGTAGGVLREREAGVVRRADERGDERVAGRDPLPGPQPDPGPVARAAPGLTVTQASRPSRPPGGPGRS